jgi:threonine dehydratase
VLVTEDEVAVAVALLAERAKIIAEGSAAAHSRQSGQRNSHSQAMSPS